MKSFSFKQPTPTPLKIHSAPQTHLLRRNRSCVNIIKILDQSPSTEDKKIPISSVR